VELTTRETITGLPIRGVIVEGDVREAMDANKSGPQQPEPPVQQTGTYDHDPPMLPSVETGRIPAALNIKPVERTPTQSSGVKKKSKRTIPTCDRAPLLT